MSPDQIKLADAVAAQLGLQPAPGSDGHWSRVFSLPDGGRLYVSSGRQRGQLSISTSVANDLREHRPYYRDGEAPKTSINVSEAKDAKRIAADVQRRLLPEYERDASACAANKARHDDYNAQRLIDRFTFYYLPTSTFDVLSSPNFVKFWIDEKAGAGGRQKIAIMEDAEELLLPRDESSRTKVSNLLNIADGFLGEHLRLHVIATTNAPVRELDPALLRPGRLMGTREFRRLSRDEALRLAEAKGLKLAEQDDYSLAELYCGGVSGSVLNPDRQVGFAQ